jgi:hypothetical protein
VPVTFTPDTQDTITECGSGKQGSSIPWCYDYTDGILSVTMNMNFPEFTSSYQQGQQDGCQPASYCTWNPSKNSCGCALETDGTVSLTRAQLSMLLEGIDWRRPVRTAEPQLAI